MITAGIEEGRDAYAVDLFSPPRIPNDITEQQLQPIRAFHQQASRLAELDTGPVPRYFQNYLYATHAVSTDTQLIPHVDVYRRYRREWVALIADPSRIGFPWIARTGSSTYAQGATA